MPGAALKIPSVRNNIEARNLVRQAEGSGLEIKTGDDSSSPVCLTDSFRFLFPLPDCFPVGVVVDIAIGVRIAVRTRVHRVAKVAHGLLCFALNLLSRTVNLSTGVAGPLADLTLRAARRIIN